MGDRKKEVVTTLLLEKKSSTQDVDKVSDELEDMKRPTRKKESINWLLFIYITDFTADKIENNNNKFRHC